VDLAGGFGLLVSLGSEGSGKNATNGHGRFYLGGGYRGGYPWGIYTAVQGGPSKETVNRAEKSENPRTTEKVRTMGGKRKGGMLNLQKKDRPTKKFV